MNIIKIIILLLVYSIVKINCGTYNHLDLQLALLILSAGNNTDNIVENLTNSGYLTIKVKNKGSSSENVSIVDIIPSLKEIQDNDGLYPTEDDKKKAITRKFKKLYTKVEHIACNKLGHTYEAHGSLFIRYYNVESEYMRSQFNEKLDNLDIFSELNEDIIKLINDNHDVFTLSFYDSNSGRFSLSSTFGINYKNFIDYVVYKANNPKYRDFNIKGTDGYWKQQNSPIINDFKEVAKVCNKVENCRKLFVVKPDPNKKWKNTVYDTKYSLIKDNKNDNYYFSVIDETNNQINTFPIKRYQIGDYEIEKDANGQAKVFPNYKSIKKESII